MSAPLTLTAPLTRWQGDRGIYHLLVLTGEAAEQIAMHARLHRLEFGQRRGFGSVKVAVRIGGTRWHSSVFPQQKQSEWILLVSKKVMRGEDLSGGDLVAVELELL
ncbi:DUF1905 domain-containing protein [Allopontixanthobacter sp.]|uniref:DUF1905 domain-containing protein n=1 Tax=Allopontixanthobacter sp. TaxID=2906452 RepID=UPI002ABBE600|nr:DUF1905 domain-containing protein [Allopontixanthobacter sp.]MDZ4307210.1 DUF1905 domain-containing protein [Allopontixanthobacter sp.]